MHPLVSVLLVFSHLLLFAAGVYAYHAVRVLSLRPLGGLARPSAGQIKKLEMEAKKELDKLQKAEAYNHFDRFNKPLEVYDPGPDPVVPNVNKVRESGFVPAK